MASNKRKTDEKHLKLLREMVALAHNKQCFDCHQRGPTYINMTIGSFVCTACSGQLRGLNPPNRVKSISMASFTQDEMDFVKSHGNEFCRKVWLGLYDNKLGSQSESREESKVKDFMANKYERKRWYVAPTEAMKEEARKMNESTMVTKATGTKPLKALLGQNTPALILGNSDEERVVEVAEVSQGDFFGREDVVEEYLEKRSDFVETKQHKTATPPPIVHPVSNSPQLPSPTLQSPGNQSIQSSKSTGSTAMDLLGDLGGDPFASSAQPPTATGGFADFGNFAAPSTGPPAFAQNAPLHLGGTTGTAAPPVNGSFTAAQTNIAAMMGGDKYSHLQDLFSVEPSKTEAQPTTAVDWNGGQGVSWNSTVAPAGSTPSGGPIKWGGESNSSTNVGTGGVNWNSSSTTTATSVGGGAGWGGASSSGTGMSWNTPATVQSNVSNPFGGGTNTSLSTQPANTGAPNPFATQQQPQPGAAQGTGGFTQFGSAAPSAAGFGSFATSATTSAGFGQFPSSATTTSAGFGQFASNTSTTGGGFGQGQFTGSAAPSAGGFGQFSVQQNGGFSSATPTGAFGAAQTNTQAGFGQPATGFGGQQTGFPQQAAGFGAQGFGGQPGQPAQGFGQPAGGFGGQPQGFGAPQGAGWGQPAAGSSVNPFMSSASQPASAPKGSTTNPFL